MSEQIYRKPYQDVMLTVETLGDPGIDNAHHMYIAKAVDPQGPEYSIKVDFQYADAGCVGSNGLRNVQLLAILIDRLKGIQSGDYASTENALALDKCQAALTWLEFGEAKSA